MNIQNAKGKGEREREGAREKEENVKMIKTYLLICDAAFTSRLN